MAKFDTLVDDFTATTNNAAKWAPFATGTATQARTAGQLVFTPPTATIGSNYAGYDSVAAFDLIASYCYVQVAQMVSTTTHAQCYMKLTLDASNNIQIIQEFGTIKAQKTVTGATADIAAGVTYNATTHKWWRIREASGTTFFDFSPDGLTWTNHTSLLNPFALTALKVEIATGTYQSEVAPSAAKFDNFNTLGAHNLSLLGVGV